jgi:ribosome-associated protein
MAEAIADKKGLDIRILDVADVCSFASFLVLATGTSARHTKALADATQEKCRELGVRPLGVEGERPGNWVLVDLGDVVVHVFREEARDFYSLDRLWGEAEELKTAVAGA